MSVLDDRVVELWRSGDYSLQMLGDRFGVTRQAVKRYLNRRGCKTDKGQGWKEVECTECGEVVKRPRCQRRITKKPYCSQGCYFKALHNPDYVQHRQGQRDARMLVKTMFGLEDGHVVHHVDGNTRNNKPGNLMVFRNQGDHLRWHRLDGEKSGVKPLWP